MTNRKAKDRNYLPTRPPHLLAPGHWKYFLPFSKLAFACDESSFLEGRGGCYNSISNCYVLVVSGRGVLNIGKLGQGSQAQKHTGLNLFSNLGK